MNCPKCNTEMKIMCYLGDTVLSDGIKHRKVIGRCEDCDFDAEWEIIIRPSGDIEERDLKRYFFG